MRTTKIWRVKVVATKEEKEFNSSREAYDWISLVVHTFGMKQMKFEVTEITEIKYLETYSLE